MKKTLPKVSIILIMALFFTIPQTKAQSTKICVISDIHIFDSTLLIQDGVAFQTYLAYDRKLLKESVAILESVLDSIKNLQPDILLVSGDLTKDGELVSHQTVANYFQEMENAGIEVFVAPGNHDINNPHAISYDGDSMIPVPSVSPSDFSTLFNNFGYSAAIYKDTASLSYVAEPVNGIWILSMDVCRYDSNYYYLHPETSGGFKPATFNWVKDRLTEAKANHKLVLGMAHHGFIEHYPGQKSLFSDYVIDDWDTISTQVADLGLKVVFTGHYHSQDIVMKTTNAGNTIYDIETGATVTYPCPYRIIELTADTLLIVNGKKVEHVNVFTDTLSFQEYAKTFLETGLPNLVLYMLMSPPYNIDTATAIMIEPAITETFVAHYAGNEGTPSAQTQGTIDLLKLNPSYAFIGYALEGIWNDLPTDDWQVSIDMQDYTIGVTEIIDYNMIKVFPNPVADQLNVLFPEIKSHVTLRIYDMQGKTVFNESVTGKQFVNINMSDTESGMYFLEIQIGSTLLRNKIIVE